VPSFILSGAHSRTKWTLRPDSARLTASIDIEAIISFRRLADTGVAGNRHGDMRERSGSLALQVQVQEGFVTNGEAFQSLQRARAARAGA
jgi:hypothetical protein